MNADKHGHIDPSAFIRIHLRPILFFGSETYWQAERRESPQLLPARAFLSGPLHHVSVV
jgi:hypothetical protein